MMKRKKRINQKNSIIPDYEIFKQEVTSKLRSGTGLTGEVGVLTGLINRIVTAAKVTLVCRAERKSALLAPCADTLYRILPVNLHISPILPANFV